MEKIIQINYQGRNISIEENALTTFQAYENELKTYFQNEEGGDEIIVDLQYRMAEILEQKLSAGAVAITQSDIEELMATIGRPSELDETTFESSNETETNSAFSERKKLFRDASKPGKIIGGVCSGIANYFAIDPLAVRLLFILVSVFGAIQFFNFNVGIISYIILWIVLPAKELKDSITKKLFRNPKDKIIGGVCGGISHFFNIEVWIVRIIFLVPLLIGGISGNWYGAHSIHIFGESIGSMAFFSYLILMIIVPKAKTSTDYMLLKGEPINIATIQNPAAINSIKQSSNSGLNSFLKVIAYILLAMFLISFIPVVFAVLLGSVMSYKFSDFILFSSFNKTLAVITFCFVFALPLVWLITGLIRRLAGYKPNRALRVVYLSLHTVGWIAAALLAFNLYTSNGTYVSKEIKIPLATTQDTLFVKSANLDSTIKEHIVFDMNQFNQLVETQGDKNLVSGVRLKYKETDEPNFYVEIEKSGCGSNRNNANENIDATVYQIREYGNSIFIPATLQVSNREPYHFQNVKVTVYVPRNKTVVIEKQLRNELANSFRFYKNNFSFNFNDKHKKDEIYSRLDDVIRIKDSSVSTSDENDVTIDVSDKNEALEESRQQLIEQKREMEDQIREAKRKLEDARIESERAIQEAQKEIDKLSNSN